MLLVTRRSGEAVRIAESSLVGAKVVPAAPARRRGPAAGFGELARVQARGWPPVESEPLGEWTLRAAGGFTRRANSALPLGDPGLPLDAALDRVRAWYAARGLPAYLQAATGAEGTQERLCAALEERGWLREVTAEVRIGGLAPLADLASPADLVPSADLAGLAPDASGAARVTLSREPDEDWFRRYRRCAEPGPEVRAVVTGGPSVWFATVPGTGGPDRAPDPVGGPADGPTTGGPADGGPAAIGRCVIDGRWAGFMAVEVDPARRRQGLATAVMAALARQALAEGASAAWLQVETDNAPARALHDRLGFTIHHHYHHFRAPGSGT